MYTLILVLSLRSTFISNINDDESHIFVKVINRNILLTVTYICLAISISMTIMLAKC